jgi:predicted CopG family antitoxin
MLSKFYSLDECGTHDEVYEYLETLKEEGKIAFSTVDLDVIKIKDTGLTVKETKELVKFLEENDVIEYDDFQPSTYDEEEDDDFDDFEDEDDDYEEDEY